MANAGIPGGGKRGGYGATGTTHGPDGERLPAGGARKSDGIANIEKQNNKILTGAPSWSALCFVVLVGVFTYLRHLSPAVPWLCTVAAACLLLVGTLPAVSVGSQGKMTWLPFLTCFLALFMGVTCGMVNSATIQPWVYAKHLHHYKEVLPDTDPLLISDGGIVQFAAGVAVDVGSSAGFRAWSTTYCAAPIVKTYRSGGNATSANTTAGAIGFWAVGANCCESRGGFDCDSASDLNARGGLRVETGQDSGAGYEQAVQMAAAAYGITLHPNVVYIAWHRDPEGVANHCWWAALATFLFLIAAALGCGLGCTSVFAKAGR